MRVIHSYWVALAISAVFFILYMFAPWAYWTLEPGMQSLLSYGGYGALFEIPEWIFWFQLGIALVSYIGMALFRKSFRLIFVLFIVFSLLLSPIYGASVITGIEVFIIDTSTLLAGFAIALSFYTSLNEKFY
ncbi:MAG: hypothetical protein KZQ80_10495 [Candidatus Thiodiazotropha sp. (ex Monitilora ramsayi)]|nr:hypothetical protein [Candidatus Thiodiazotropha sp. (ex Monitilora ramsayi)]